MNLRYAGAVLVILLAGCSASHTANPTSVLPGAPSLTSPEGVNPFKLSTKNIIHRYPLPNPNSGPFFMATGSDKNVWFTENSAARIGMITPSGVITEYAIPSGDYAGTDIAAGTAGTLWFGQCNYNLTCYFTDIGKITTAGHITEYALPTYHCATGITKGPDGNMWFTWDEPKNGSQG